MNKANRSKKSLQNTCLVMLAFTNKFAAAAYKNPITDERQQSRLATKNDFRGRNIVKCLLI